MSKLELVQHNSVYPPCSSFELPRVTHVVPIDELMPQTLILHMI